jgi:hypothetical protein
VRFFADRARNHKDSTIHVDDRAREVNDAPRRLDERTDEINQTALIVHNPL